MMTEMVFPPLEPLLKSPKLSLYARAIQTYLDEEHEKREAFYDWLTEDINAEFINGEVIVQTPANNRHTVASMNLSTLLSTSVELNDLGFVGAETVLISLIRNDYLPDICFFDKAKASIRPDQVKYPAPDFVVEILSPSIDGIDRGTKFEDYAAHGVAKYWLIDPEKQTVEQYTLRESEYELLFKVQEGSLSSMVVAGFTIPVAAIFDHKLKNQVLGQMIVVD